MQAFSSARIFFRRLPDRLRNGLMGWLTLFLVPIGIAVLFGMSWAAVPARRPPGTTTGYHLR